MNERRTFNSLLGQFERTENERDKALAEADQLREAVRLALSEHGTYNDLIERLHAALGDTPDECQE
jgi:hypothetical protein